MSGSAGNIYSPSGTQQSGQNVNALNLLDQSANSAAGYAPQVQQQATNLTSQYINNPYQPAAQTAANSAGAYGTGTVVPQQQAGAASLNSVGNANAAYAPQALAAGFDPQNALYNRNFQQSQDQQNAINAQNGVAGTPYAAGISGQVGNNFNLDWINQALGRQNTAANTASTLTNSANTGITGASNLGQQAMQTQATAGGLPASTYGQNLAQDIAALSGQNAAVQGAGQVTDQAIQNILAYLGYGTNAGAAAAKAQDSTFGGIGNLIGTALPYMLPLAGA